MNFSKRYIEYAYFSFNIHTVFRLKVLLVVPIVSVRKQIRQTFSLAVKKVADIPHII